MTLQTHVCVPYRNARGELIDPATQGGIGCPVCRPPIGRVVRTDSTKEDTNAG